MIEKIVLIEWDDSNVVHGWRMNTCEEDNVAHCRIVGIVKAETDETITLAFGDSDLGSVMETITIPCSSIFSFKELEVKNALSKNNQIEW